MMRRSTKLKSKGFNNVLKPHNQEVLRSSLRLRWRVTLKTYWSKRQKSCLWQHSRQSEPYRIWSKIRMLKLSARSSRSSKSRRKLWCIKRRTLKPSHISMTYFIRGIEIVSMSRSTYPITGSPLNNSILSSRLLQWCKHTRWSLKRRMRRSVTSRSNLKPRGKQSRNWRKIWCASWTRKNSYKATSLSNSVRTRLSNTGNRLSASRS